MAGHQPKAEGGATKGSKAMPFRSATSMASVSSKLRAPIRYKAAMGGIQHVAVVVGVGPVHGPKAAPCCALLDHGGLHLVAPLLFVHRVEQHGQRRPTPGRAVGAERRVEHPSAACPLAVLLGLPQPFDGPAVPFQAPVFDGRVLAFAGPWPHRDHRKPWRQPEAVRQRDSAIVLGRMVQLQQARLGEQAAAPGVPLGHRASAVS